VNICHVSVERLVDNYRIYPQNAGNFGFTEPVVHKMPERIARGALVLSEVFGTL
jgi:hypothetical protein